MKEINNVELDKIVENILLENSKTPYVDIFETITDCLGDNYSLDDLIDYIEDKDCLKHKFYIILAEQKYDRNKYGEHIYIENIKDSI